ncbi:AbrB/MazE/SpoVT family DNA-binding domain-containing protein [Desulfosporosinus metallidurans]|uniref:Transcriptional regulator, AbrB family n=1 Tax=Desulfosporosinus metallidurans TaxID=1888891 RepID=A0A1Q8QMD3_9FIRM|nr:AbrB/MazE/SpoVT family DNA-binding domain-containing protein [Desulfosporosinus metallidurans]OLN28501.1 Transcriptional regulator, AbrB family [Desulfosporosinus metallidurans]
MMQHGKFYGSTVMGERGQVVIPVEAREEIGIEPGEKLVVLGNKRRGVVILFKSDVMTRFADMMFRKARFFEEMFSSPLEDSEQGKTKG